MVTCNVSIDMLRFLYKFQRALKIFVYNWSFLFQIQLLSKQPINRLTKQHGRLGTPSYFVAAPSNQVTSCARQPRYLKQAGLITANNRYQLGGSTPASTEQQTQICQHGLFGCLSNGFMALLPSDKGGSSAPYSDSSQLFSAGHPGQLAGNLCP